MNIYQSNPIEKTSAGYISIVNQRFKRGSKWRTDSPVYPFLLLIYQFQIVTRGTSLEVTTVFHAREYGRFIEIYSNLWRKKLHETNQSFNFLWGRFSNRDNVKVPIQFRRESQPQHFKGRFFLKNRPIHFHIRSTSIIRRAKRNQLSFSSIEINKPLPAPVQCLVDQIQVQKPILVVVTNQMPDHI